MIIVKRGSRKVDHEIGILLHQFIHGADPVEWIIAQVPDVFTNGDGQFLAHEFNTIPTVCRLKIAVFIKDIVIGKQALGGNSLDLAIEQEQG